MAVVSATTLSRFWSKVAVSGPDNCWPWTAARTGNGYGNFKVRELSEHMAAHRFAYWLKTERYPDGLVVRHKCDNPVCVNPAHLEGGTQADNMRDKAERGRAYSGNQSGEANPSSKLCASDVLEIRRQIALGRPNTDIASEFGVHHATISNIRNGKVWKHVADAPSPAPHLRRVL